MFAVDAHSNDDEESGADAERERNADSNWLHQSTYFGAVGTPSNINHLLPSIDDYEHREMILLQMRYLNIEN